ncbi:carboxylesterase/lipase family protein [Hydrocarboniphaga sp.]|uniref:carboxylesterase/lipase family protein n=1 Tax=Hydrocarboniphaga sp. TaxID=2033016 RepID=UPI003D0F6648
MTTIRINNGAIAGDTEDGIHVFRGIPYAEPVGGLARWLPPQPRKPWSGTLDARHYGDACLQFAGATGGLRWPIPSARARYLDAIGGSLEIKQGDDSLLLNVWTPSLDAGAKLPVMLWIHGGGFTAGAANSLYDGTPFARRNVVIVVIQYRLGPPGFLHGSGLFDGEFCADNRGLLDQVEALRWVQQNIAAFGGDASNVTVFGESAGAFALYQLAASPQAKGLFHRGIAMGGMPDTCAPADDYHALARDVLADVGVKAGDAQALAALDQAQLMKLQSAMSKRTMRGPDPDRYGSLSRRKIAYMGAATGGAFLPQSPMTVYPQGTPNDIDLMLGTCRDDGQLFSLVFPLWQSLSARLFSTVLDGLVPNRDLRAAREHYGRLTLQGGRSVAQEINHDAFYRMPTIRAAEAHAAGHPGRTYLYQLDYESAIEGLGAVHGIDVALSFRCTPARRLLRDDEPTRLLCEQMLDAWTSFARNGKPQVRGLAPWTPYDTQTRTTMVFDTPARLAPDWGGERRPFWADVSLA